MCVVRDLNPQPTELQPFTDPITDNLKVANPFNFYDLALRAPVVPHKIVSRIILVTHPSEPLTNLR